MKKEKLGATMSATKPLAIGPRKHVLGTPESDWLDWLSAHGQPAYRFRQIRDWIVKRRAAEFAEMTDLPASLRNHLNSEFCVFSVQVAHVAADQDCTRKLLLRLQDGRTIESVLLAEANRRTICMSTQVGCAMGCVFCASGLDGVERNLESVELIEQLILTRNQLPPHERVDHVVVMGMGEPLANLDNLLLALEFAVASDGLGISARNITISTVGLPRKILQLARADRQYHLAVSLHAPNDRLREVIVPTAEKVALREILEAADEYRQLTGRQVTFEYVLLGGVNDDASCARELSELLNSRDAMINLIPYNPVAGLPWRTPDPSRTLQFATTLRNAGLVVKVRKRKGTRIDAACGQLRRTLARQLHTVPLPSGIQESDRS